MKGINFVSVFSRVKTAGISALVASATLLSVAEVSAHGYVSSPKSRVLVCKENGVENPTLPACIAAKAEGNTGFYSPQYIQIGGVIDNHQAFVPDGKLCSAGLNLFRGLDLTRMDWPATQVTAGSREFVWTNTARHNIRYYRYYITKEGYNPANPLRWADLEQIYQSPSSRLEATSRHVVNLPPRSGKHVVYSIRQRDHVTDAAEAYYQCIDVEYRNSSSSAPSSSSVPSSRASSSASSTGDLCASPAYVNGSTYLNGALVTNAGSAYRCTVAGWCSVGGPYAPGTGWAWTNAWTRVRSCN